MYLVELFENTILADVDGWWVSPRGQEYSISTDEGHTKFVLNNYEWFTESNVLEFDSLYDRAFYFGWVRLAKYKYGRTKNVSIEGRKKDIIRVHSKLLDIVEDFNRVEVNVLGEQPIKSGNDKLLYESIQHELFTLPQEIEYLEDFLRGKSSR